MYEECGSIEKVVNYLKKCFKKMWSHGGGISNNSLPCWYGWKPKIGASKKLHGCLEKIYQSIIVSNNIDKVVNCLNFKKCLKEMQSHGDGMPWQSIAICLSLHSSWHSITMRLHFFETFFSSSSLPCLCYHIFHTCLPNHFIKQFIALLLWLKV